MKGGKISLIDESTSASVATPEKATASAKKPKTPTTNKKRKMTVKDGERSEDKKGEKKVKRDAKFHATNVNQTNDSNGDAELA